MPPGTGREGTIGMITKTPLTPGRKVALLWLLLLSFFAIFNLAYLPISRVQEAQSPLRFEQRAAEMAAEGQTVAAATVLRDGIRAFRPPFPEPYARLAEYGAGDLSAQAAPLARFYQLADDGLTEEEIAALRGSKSWSSLAPPDQSGLLAAIRLFAYRGMFAFPMDPTGAWPLGIEDAATVLSLAQGVLRTDGAIGTTGVSAPVPIVSASGGRALLHIDGVNYGGVKRAMYVAIVSPIDGQILQLGHFDLNESWDESLRMAQFLQGARQGAIGVFAASEEASVYLDYTHLGPELEYFGLEREAIIGHDRKFLGLKFAFAAIGVKGAPPGSGLQAWSPGEFDGRTGHPVCCAVFPARKEPQ